VTTAVLLLALALLCVVPDAPDPLDGRYQSARYGLGVMQRVAKKRGLAFRSVGVQCGASMDGPGIGAWIRVTGVRTGVVRECQVVDVSQTVDLKRHLKARQIEIDDRSARAVCGAKAYRSRPKECPVDVVVISRP